MAARLRERGERPTPVLIEQELARFERLQAALAAVQAVRQAGGAAHYHCVDLTDADAVAKVMAEVRTVSGRIDVLLHAAGLEISHALPDKEPRRVRPGLRREGDGWFNVLAGAGDLPIGATVAFSSVAGRFGNAGPDRLQRGERPAVQGDQQLAAHPARHPRRSSLDWTAWGGIGMATRGSIPKIMEMAGDRDAAAGGRGGLDPPGADQRAPTAARSWSPARSAPMADGTRPDRWAGHGALPGGRGRPDGRRRSGAAMSTTDWSSGPTLDPAAAAVPRPPPHRRHRRCCPG